MCLHTKEKLYSHHNKKAPPFPTVLILRSSVWDKCLFLNQREWSGAKCPFCGWRPLSSRPLRETSIKSETISVWPCTGIPRLAPLPAFLFPTAPPPIFCIMLIFGGKEEVKMLLNLKKCAFVLILFITVWSMMSVNGESISNLWDLVLLCDTCKEIYLTSEC